jgi:hypothetical protein
MDITEEVTVTYTVRDLLAEIRDDVKQVKHQLDNKVDKSEFVKLETDVEARLGHLESFKWKALGVVAALAGAGPFVAQVVLK